MRLFEKTRQLLQTDLMLHHKLLLAANSFCYGFVEELEQCVLLWRIQTREDWNVVLALRAKDCARSDSIDKVSTANVSKQMYLTCLFQSSAHAKIL